MVHCVRFHQLGGPEVLTIEPAEIGDPGPGEVRIRVQAIGLNRVESMYRSGGFGVPKLPSKIGYEASGVVQAIGPGIQGFAIGDRVATIPGASMEQYGTYGQEILYPAAMLVRIPDGLSFLAAAATWMPYLTAYGLIAVADMRGGDSVLLTAASSSVGLAAIQIVNAVGGISIAVTGSENKIDALRHHGASHVLSSRGVADGVTRVLGNQGGPRIVFDAVAGPSFPELVAVAAPGGIIMIYGTLGGAVTPLPAEVAMGKNLTVRGYAMNHMLADADVRRKALAFIVEGLRSGALKPVIDRVFEFDQIVAAHRYLERNTQIGKIVVRVSH